MPIDHLMSAPVVSLAATPSDELAFYEYLIAQGLSPRTRSEYMRHFTRVDRWCRAAGFDAATAPPSVIADYAATTPYTHSNRGQLRAALRHFWEMVDRARPPLKAVAVPRKPEPVWRGFEDPAAHALDLAARRHLGPDGTAVLAGIYTGMRAGEIAAIHWARFDYDLALYTCFGKGARTRHLAIPPSPFRERLEVVPPAARTGWLFPGSAGREHVHPTTVLTWTKRIAREAGLPGAAGVHTHQMRHTVINKIAEESGDLRLAQAQAGHSRSSTTEGYTRIRVDRLRFAAGLIRYDPDESIAAAG